MEAVDKDTCETGDLVTKTHRGLSDFLLFLQKILSLTLSSTIPPISFLSAFLPLFFFFIFFWQQWKPAHSSHNSSVFSIFSPFSILRSPTFQDCKSPPDLGAYMLVGPLGMKPATLRSLKCAVQGEEGMLNDRNRIWTNEYKIKFRTLEGALARWGYWSFVSFPANPPLHPYIKRFEKFFTPRFYLSKTVIIRELLPYVFPLGYIRINNERNLLVQIFKIWFLSGC